MPRVQSSSSLQLTHLNTHTHTGYLRFAPNDHNCLIHEYRIILSGSEYDTFKRIACQPTEICWEFWCKQQLRAGEVDANKVTGHHRVIKTGLRTRHPVTADHNSIAMKTVDPFRSVAIADVERHPSGCHCRWNAPNKAALVVEWWMQSSDRSVLMRGCYCCGCTHCSKHPRTLTLCEIDYEGHWHDHDTWGYPKSANPMHS